MKRKTLFLAISLSFLLCTANARAAVDVSISVGVPPPVVFTAPPDVVVVPSGPAYVYLVPGRPGLYFYNNFWYRFHGGRWYWAHSYDGRWRYIETHLVPRYIIDVPTDYWRRLPPGYNRIRYNDLHRHWYGWEKNRHWDKYDWFKREQKRRHAAEFRRDWDRSLPDKSREFNKDRMKQKSRGKEKRHEGDGKGRQDR